LPEAACKDVKPSSGAGASFMEAPASSRIRTTSVWPFSAAACSAVRPPFSVGTSSTYDPVANNLLTSLISPDDAASCNAERPLLSALIDRRNLTNSGDVGLSLSIPAMEVSAYGQLFFQIGYDMVFR
jgi:hypothetical protein